MMKQKRVVYILGAGFSYPLGLPLIANFEQTGVNLNTAGAIDISEAQKIFSRINRGLRYFRPDVTNIEEVLSILECGELAGHTSDSDKFREYISQVVRASTPVLENPTERISFGDNLLNPQDLHNLVSFSPSTNQIWWDYVVFVAMLVGSQVEVMKRAGMPIDETDLNIKPSGTDTKYTVISLNYDLVLENCCALLNTYGRGGNDFNIIVPNQSPECRKPDTYPKLIKLHGCLSKPETIRTPTWNKVVSGSEDNSCWKEACDELCLANELRIIGYSLPMSDTYMTSLLKYAFSHNENRLSRIDIVNPDTELKERYKMLFGGTTTLYNFYASMTEDYLRLLNNNLLPLLHKDNDSRSASSAVRANFAFLEEAHKNTVSGMKKLL